jgi:hypothetical protein
MTKQLRPLSLSSLSARPVRNARKRLDDIDQITRQSLGIDLTVPPEEDFTFSNWSPDPLTINSTGTPSVPLLTISGINMNLQRLGDNDPNDLVTITFQLTFTITIQGYYVHLQDGVQPTFFYLNIMSSDGEFVIPSFNVAFTIECYPTYTIPFTIGGGGTTGGGVQIASAQLVPNTDLTYFQCPGAP